MAMPRMFIALEPPGYIRAAIRELHEPLRGVNWTPEDNIHLTLKFVGEVDHEMADHILTALETVAIKPFLLELGGVGCFPLKRSPQVVWTGMGKAHPHLYQLQTKVEDTLFRIGIEPTPRKFTPHVTIGRCDGVSHETIRQYLRRHADWQSAPFSVEAFTLFESEERPGMGRRYRRWGVFPLETVA